MAEKLSLALAEYSGSPEDDETIANVIAKFVPIFLDERLAAKYFYFWQENGFHITPVHFYQPVPDTRLLSDELWSRAQETPGVDWNDAVQLDLLKNQFPRFQDEYAALPDAPGDDPSQFYFNNGAFDGTDALVLYCIVRHFQPRRIVEVGSGFSSRLSARALDRNYPSGQLVCIEPFPDDIIASGFPGLSELITKRVQDVPLDLFQMLDCNDILFIDSSHVVSIGSDVNFLVLDVLPRLRPGVIVHFHDIFLPGLYPKYWVKDLRLFWTEQFLIQAFLTHNSEFEVLFSNAYIGAKYLSEMQATFQRSPWWGGGSLWLRKKQTGGPELTFR